MFKFGRSGRRLDSYVETDSKRLTSGDSNFYARPVGTQVPAHVAGAVSREAFKGTHPLLIGTTIVRFIGFGRFRHDARQTLYEQRELLRNTQVWTRNPTESGLAIHRRKKVGAGLAAITAVSVLAAGYVGVYKPAQESNIGPAQAEPGTPSTDASSDETLPPITTSQGIDLPRASEVTFESNGIACSGPTVHIDYIKSDNKTPLIALQRTTNQPWTQLPNDVAEGVWSDAVSQFGEDNASGFDFPSSCIGNKLQ